ncbi:hypothetical protein Q4E93_03045 [Flavitalea sp. BT771]|uniref:hypothetical protein n=1 Tax=Flavitalea sp. BT771 TaxID=3063329 RepID=UPI0026E2C0F5|nr:hypothetical protein [Flavitalea sp. BT771]MDO6429550.1 hypothetical protein [Flavitalea sp. BT771]MDV6218322.1 hypothetical protein [Flavitalea sp. BT771]
MNSEITRVRNAKGQPASPQTFEPLVLAWTENDSLARLDVEIYDKGKTPGKTKPIRRFFFRIDSGEIIPLVFTSKDLVVRNAPKNGPSSTLYQFPINYDAFTEGGNTLTFYEDITDRDQQFTIPGSTPPIGDVVSLPQNDGSSVDVVPFAVIKLKAQPEKNEVNVKLERPGIEETTDKILWKAIKAHSLKFEEYEHFIDTILDHNVPDAGGRHFNRKSAKRRSPFVKSEEYNLIKFATEFHMLSKFGLNEKELIGYVGSSGKLPYYDFVIDRIRDDLKLDSLSEDYEDESGGDVARREEQRLYNPFMTELIWSYWMEQAGLAQTMNVINLRFQNIRTDVFSDRLQRFDADPLRPLSYILWGYIQDEQHRLSLPRRVNEYDHEYGLLLTGRAVNKSNNVDTRVKFLEAFHNLLNLSFVYFKESDDTTYIADAFPVLNALREVHLLLAEGNHNAYGNLTWTARQEMMMQQYILARPEMREFLGGRVMVPYPETWMDRVDTMRHIQQWGETSVLHYYELAIHGEQILLSIRYGNWSDVTLDRNNAANWAQEFRNNIYRYTHAYRVVTGVDLTMDKVQSTSTFAIQPAYLIQQRLMQERGNGTFVQNQRMMVRAKDRRV